jgi:hypothetical protein
MNEAAAVLIVQVRLTGTAFGTSLAAALPRMSRNSDSGEARWSNREWRVEGHRNLCPNVEFIDAMGRRGPR